MYRLLNVQVSLHSGQQWPPPTVPTASTQPICHIIQSEVEGRGVSPEKCSTIFPDFIRTEKSLSNTSFILKVFYISSWKLDSHWKGVGTSLKPGRSESSGFFAYWVASPWWDRPRSAWQKTLMLKASLSQYIYSAVMLLHLKPKQNKMGANFTLKWDLTVVCHILRSDFFPIRSVKPV